MPALRRREFITLLGGAATWPLRARAQQQMPVIGFLHSTSPDATPWSPAGFHRGLAETGYVEGRNVAVRWAEGRYDQLPVPSPRRRDCRGWHLSPRPRRKGGNLDDPSCLPDWERPGQGRSCRQLESASGNVTGLSRLSFALAPKRLELLHELVPKATVIAFLVNPANPVAASQIQEIREPARSLGLQVRVLEASSEGQIEIAFETLMQQHVGALLLANDTFLHGRRELFIALAARHAIPVMYPARQAVAAGGLMSYDASAEDSFRQVGTYVGRILKGEKSADLPVLQPTKFELAINVKSAKALGLEVPPMLLARADEVIE